MVRVVVFSLSIYPNEQELSKGMPGKEDRNLTQGGEANGNDSDGVERHLLSHIRKGCKIIVKQNI